jgi:hypothetical protein
VEPNRPNTLRDQAVPNVLPATEVHPAPERVSVEADGNDPARVEQWEGQHATTPAERAKLEGIASRLQALADSFATRAVGVEARLLEGFEKAAARFAGQCGELAIRNDDDERIWFRADGSFSGEVVPEDAPKSWRSLETALDVVDFYDPSELLAELADRLVEAYPGIGRADEESAGPRLRQLAEAFAEQNASVGPLSEPEEAILVEQFEASAAPFTRKIGDIIFRDESDERLTLERDGRFLAEVVPEDDENVWRALRTADDITEFYAPNELFRALADLLDTAYPATPDEGPDVAAETLHTMALLWRLQALDAEATLFDEFGQASTGLARELGRFTIVDDDDEQLMIDGDGQLLARVLDRSTGAWRELARPDELVESYDPTDVFEDLADALAEAFQSADR